MRETRSDFGVRVFHFLAGESFKEWEMDAKEAAVSPNPYKVIRGLKAVDPDEKYFHIEQQDDPRITRSIRKCARQRKSDRRRAHKKRRRSKSKGA